ncbi:MAG TPA: ABC transporter permease, partial [Flavobacterium sp.]|nr:ABC transporter permease [Flavobacterium sp.]
MYFKYFLRQAWINFKKSFAFTAINIFGLTIGISGFLVIYIFVAYDLNFDRFHKDIDRIYRVVSKGEMAGQDYKYSGVPMPLATSILSNIAGIETASVVHLYGKNVSARIKEKKSSSQPASFEEQSNIVFTDSNYFKIFDYEWIAGSPAALGEPYSVVLTANRVRLYFPGEEASNIVGRSIVYNDSVQVSVTGIVQNPDHPTDLAFEEFISFKTIEIGSLKDGMYWNNWGTVLGDNQLFLKLTTNAQRGQVENELTAIFKQNAGIPLKMGFHLQALSDLHFKGEYGSFGRQADLSQLGILVVAALILLSLGCINFGNLALANASKRVNEIS